MEFYRWVATATPGTWVTYWEGNLAVARERDMNALGLARAAWASYVDGDVILVQRRIGSGSFQYLAVRRSKPVPRARPAPYLIRKMTAGK